VPKSAADLTTQAEAEIQRIGREVWDRLQRSRPTIFESRWWMDHILEWAMQDQAVMVQMLRFVDALPMLKSSEAVTQHLQEYFEDVRTKLPLAARLALEVTEPGSLLGKALAFSARNNARRMADRFVAGATVDEVYQSVYRLRRKGLAFTLERLGGAVVSEGEADAYQHAYLEAIQELAPRLAKWPEHEVLDRDTQTWAPRCQISLRLSSLDSQFRPIDAVGTSERVKGRLRPILRAAREQDIHVDVELEQTEFKPLILQIVREVLMEEEFRGVEHCGVVMQAYLADCRRDLEELLEWTKSRGTPIWVRLVKGGYWERESMAAQYRGWPSPVLAEKWQCDENFEAQTLFLFENYKLLRPAIASHNLRSLSHAAAWAKLLDIPAAAWEMQMRYGVSEGQAIAFAEQGHRVRLLTPFGDPIPGFSQLVKGLLENSTNSSILRHAYDKELGIDELLKPPAAVSQVA
jgi:RHH-type proline utilization regulon transcriptional repressor/proline dehydrogenase/delta 1-pyrroline-5-carboxylate dehydrogenase